MKRWSEDEKAIVKRLWLNNLTSDEIANELGVTRGMVMGIVRRLGLLGQNPNRRINAIKKVEVLSLRPKTGIATWKLRPPAERQLSKAELQLMLVLAAQNTAKLPIKEGFE